MSIIDWSGIPNFIIQNISNDAPLFIVGRNGTGKSAFMHALRQCSPGKVVYLPGTRTAAFDSDGLAMTSATRRQFMANLPGWDASPETRWRMIVGNQRNDKAIHDLTAAEVQFKIELANIIAAGKENTEAAISVLRKYNSPLDKVNLLLEQANISVRIAVSEGELRAVQSDGVYSFARMSDGERIALILIAEIVSAEAGSIFYIDEPEMRLHRSIIMPLITYLVSSRADCAFVMATHELDLPVEIANSVVCIMRGAIWNDGHAARWDIDLIKPDEIPEDLKVDILGSRRKILFIEGGSLSLDKPLYATLFPFASLRPKESCKEVVRAVAGVRSSQDSHHIQAYGIIDNDGMSEDHVAAFALDGVYALSMFSVESLYYCKAVRAAVALRQAEMLSPDYSGRVKLANSYLEEADSRALAAICRDGRVEHLASRVAERRLREMLLGAIPSRQHMIANKGNFINIDIASPFENEVEKLKSFIENGDIDSIIAHYPVRETGALDSIAKALQFLNRSVYESAVLAAVSSNSTLANILREKFGGLASELVASN